MSRAKLSLQDWTITTLLALVMFMSGADMLIVTPILPQVARDLDVPISLGGLWVTAYGASTALLALAFGPISDAKGRRPVLLAGLCTIFLGTVGCGFAHQAWMMFVARSVAGAGAGMLVTSITSYVGDHFDAERRAVAMGFVMSGFFLSLILGVPLGAFLTDALGWNRMFHVFGAMILVVLSAVAIWLPVADREHPPQPVELAQSMRLYRKLLGQRRVLGVLLMSLAIGLSMTMFSVYASPWMEAVFGLDTKDRGLVYAVGGPAALMGGPIAGRISNSLGRVRVVLGATIMMTLMQIVMPFGVDLGELVYSSMGGDSVSFASFGNAPWPKTVATLLIFFTIMVSGASRSAPFQTLALEVVEADQRGALAAIRNSFNQLGGAMGAALGSMLWAGVGSYRTICFTSAAASIIGAGLLWGLVGSDRPLRRRSASAVSKG